MVYAVDFDGTLCENKFPEIGRPNIRLIKFLKERQLAGDKVILYTMREGTVLGKAISWLVYNHQFLPDEVNDNLPELQAKYRNNPRKIYADVYIDDHNARYGVCADFSFE